MRLVLIILSFNLLTPTLGWACGHDQNLDLLQRISRLAAKNRLGLEFKQAIIKRAVDCQRDPNLAPETLFIEPRLLTVLRKIARQETRGGDRKRVLLIIDSLGTQGRAYDVFGRSLTFDLRAGTATVNYDHPRLPIKARKVYSQPTADELLFTTRLRNQPAFEKRFNFTLPIISLSSSGESMDLSDAAEDLVRSDISFRFSSGTLGDKKDTQFSIGVSSDSPIEDLLTGKVLNEEGPSVTFEGHLIKERGRWFIDYGMTHEIRAGEENRTGLSLAATRPTAEGGAQRYLFTVNDQGNASFSSARQSLTGQDKDLLRTLELTLHLDDGDLGGAISFAQQMSGGLTGIVRIGNYQDGDERVETKEVILEGLGLLGVAAVQEGSGGLRLELRTGVEFR